MEVENIDKRVNNAVPVRNRAGAKGGSMICKDLIKDGNPYEFTTIKEMCERYLKSIQSEIEHDPNLFEDQDESEWKL